MKIMMSIVSNGIFSSTQAIIQKCCRVASEVNAKIQLSTSAMPDETTWHSLQAYTKVKTNYVQL